MKVTVSGRFMDAPIDDPLGVISFASYERIIRTMVAAGELRLGPNEKVTCVTVDAHGLAFKIEKKQ